MGEEEELSGSYESGLSQNLIHCLSTTFSVILLADKPRHTNDFSGCINNVKIQLCGDMLCPTNCVHSHAASCKVTWLLCVLFIKFISFYFNFVLIFGFINFLYAKLFIGHSLVIARALKIAAVESCHIMQLFYDNELQKAIDKGTCN